MLLFIFDKFADTLRRYPHATIDSMVGGAFLSATMLLVLPPLPSDLELGAGLECLALNIYHEARGETKIGQVAVAQVVMNRVAHEKFPGDICTVIKQGGEWPKGFCQFSWWCDGRKDIPEEAKSWRQSQDLARAILHGKHKDPTQGALWYHSREVAPHWRNAFEKGPTIGNHVFYRPKPSS